MLVKAKCNVLIADKMGRSPLHYAVEESRTAVVSLLLTHPMAKQLVVLDDVFASLFFSLPPLLLIHVFFLLLFRFSPFFACAVTQRYDNKCIHVAARYGSEEVMTVLLQSGFKQLLVAAVTDEEQTPLHIAAACNRVSLIPLLLAEAADLLSSRDERGQTPLHLASGQVSFTLGGELNK